MYLYRALNEYDLESIKSDGNIYCNLTRHNTNNQITSEIEKGNLGLSLDRIIGHVSGKNLKSSGWISTSGDFNFVASEYTIPQNGRYNLDSFRKEIALISVDEHQEIIGNIYNRKNQSTSYYGKYIDLSNNKFLNHYEKYFIRPLYSNPDSYYYDPIRDLKLLLQNKVPPITTFNNFAKAATEILFLYKINNENIIKILSPLMQDIIYDRTFKLTDNYLIEKEIKEILKKYGKISPDFILNNPNFTFTEKNLFNYLYRKEANATYNCLISLVPILYDKSTDIIDLYDCLKMIKKSLLAKIVNGNPKEINIVDDQVYVINNEYEAQEQLPNSHKITNKNKHDIIYKTDKNKVLTKYQKK